MQRSPLFEHVVQQGKSVAIYEIHNEDGALSKIALSSLDAEQAVQVILASIRGLCAPCYSEEEVENWCSNKTVENFRYWAGLDNSTVLHRGADGLDGVGMIAPSGKILLLYVLPTRTRCGVGGRILRALLDRARIDGLTCVTADASLPSINFYISHGFKASAPLAIGDVPLLDITLSKNMA